MSQAEDAQMPMWGDQRVEKGVPIIGVDYGYLWSRAPEASEAPQDEVAGEAKGFHERNRAVLAKELQARSHPRVVVRSDGEPALLAHVRAARAMTMVADVPRR